MFQDEQSDQYNIPKFLGFNQFEHSQFLAPGETQSAQNMDIQDGNLSVCKGFSKYIGTPLASGIKTLMVFYKNNTDGTVSSYLLAATSTTLYKWDGISWVSIKTGLTSGYFEYINYQKNMTDLIIMTNGNEAVFKWDGATVTDLGGNPPKFTSLSLHYERVWGTGIKSNPNQVAYSDALNPEDWTQSVNTGGIIELPTWDGGKCIAVTSIFDNIVIFKTRNIFKIYGTYPGEYANKAVFTSTGAIAKRSIVNAVTVAFFLANDGIYAYNGSQTQLISSPIKDIMNSMNDSYADKACGVFYDNKYILAIPTGSSTVNDTLIEYDTLKQSFNVKRGINVNDFVEYEGKLLFCNDDSITGNSYVYEYGSGISFNSNVINAFWETPETDFNAPNASKTSTYIYATFQGSGQLQIDSIFDGKTKTIFIDLPSTPKVLKKRLRNKGRRFKFRFSNVNGSTFTMINPKILMDVDLD